MLQLRDYQEEDANKIRVAFRSYKRVLYVAPTGSGKTVLFSYIARGAMRLHKKVLILCHRQELIDQISIALTASEVPHGIIAAGYEYRRGMPVYVASVFTFVRRLDAFEPDLIIIDEAHHCVLSTTWGAVLRHHSDARVLGVTATPIRKSGEGLGQCFEYLIDGPSYSTLIDHGHLVPLRIFAPPTINTKGLHTRAGEFITEEVEERVRKPGITGSAIEHYKRITPGKRAAIFCLSVKHTYEVAQEFNASGIPATGIDGSTNRDMRRQIIRDFSSGQLKVLTSCDLISEGFDCPGIEVGISLRPTASLGLWIQQAGRTMRPFMGKSYAVLLDHAGNTLLHGYPGDETRVWSLEGSSSDVVRTKPAIGIKICPKCFAAQKATRRDCAVCGEPFPVASRTVPGRDGELEEITPEEAKKRRTSQEVGMTKTLEALVALGKKRGYKNPSGWAQHVIEARAAKVKNGRK
jgi:DNA repair protein RadD